jgi:hypothetical protein
MKVKFHFIIFILLLFSGCGRKAKTPLFTRLSAATSGIHFSNDLHDDDSSYSFINEFGYMGGGVGIGDFNNDGLPDIFFSGNQVTCRIYANKGNNQFEDITEKAGIKTDVWATGVSIVDINNDGYDDIYVCVFGKNLLERSPNLLFINQHDLTFKEEAATYGLADTGYSTQAAFFDYDKDGDLDLYLMNYLLSDRNGNTIYPRDNSGRSPANDKLYRNDGDLLQVGHPVFTDVTIQAGIKEDGYGLGLSISDYNNDGWPDVYVTNDFLSNDELWLNNCNGTFINCIDRSIKHQSYSSMGSDAADLNNDGLPDITTLDMLPEDNERKKTSLSFMNYERYQAERQMGYEPEFMRNMLQLNNGNYLSGDTSIPFFSEIGQLAGISATDWSWSVLAADFNNDGWKDLHITNGIGRDFINADFLEFSSEVFANNQSKEQQHNAIREKLASLKHVNLSNYLFINQHNDSFADSSQSAGIDEPSMSNGAAYADLDNDGDLDLVVNNINREAFVFINNTIEKNKPIENHFLKLRLQGDSLNKAAFGAKAIVYTKGDIQMQEQYPVRGYFSSVDQQLIFGLGRGDHVDSLIVTWPDNKMNVLKNISADTVLTLSWQNADGHQAFSKTLAQVFTDVTSQLGVVYLHHDNNFNDFAIQRLLPQKYSQLGPFLTTGDINNDGKKDFFIGGGFNFSGKIFTQQNDRSFSSKNLIDGIKMEEDEDCIFFDADNDGDQDLLVTGGDVQYDESSSFYKPRLYLNDGKGNFHLDLHAIPAHATTIAGCVSAADYDNDGDLDLFIGGRVSKSYPLPPKSFILRNDHGVFTDVTAGVCPALQRVGMITAAVWTDFDNDKQIDLIIAGEWMPLRFFKNDHSHFMEVTNSTGLTEMNGMWRSLISSDIDNDGDADLVAGNLGLNCLYNVNEKCPMQLFAADLDGNGSIDPVFFYYIKDKDGVRRSFPAISRSQFAEQVPAIKKKFLLYKDYATATFNDIFKGKEKNSMLSFKCNETRSCWFENLGNGKFIKHPLPAQAQFAPVNAIICDDIDNDGFKDLLLAGNEYQAEVISGRYDASYGCFLKGSNKKTFTTIAPAESGFVIKGDVKDLSLLPLSNGKRLVLAAVNNDSLRIFQINK